MKKIFSTTGSYCTLFLVASSAVLANSGEIVVVAEEAAPGSGATGAGNGAARCRAYPSVRTARVVVGDEFEFSVLVTNTSGKPLTLFNPFLRRDVAAVNFDLFISDTSGNRLGELYQLGRRAGSYHKLAATDWTAVAAGGIIGVATCTRLSVLSRGQEQIQLGKYKLQASFRDNFDSQYPFDGLPLAPWDPAAQKDPLYLNRWKEWQVRYTGRELFHTNTVEIEVVPRNGNGSEGKEKGIERKRR